jgi:hypothetical protein
VKLATAAAIIVISLTLTGRAGMVDGNKLYEQCTSSSLVEQAHCDGFIVGIVEAGEATAVGLWATQNWGQKVPWPKDVTKGTVAGFSWCLRETVTAGQAIDAAKAFLRNNPAHRDAGASGLVAMAMQQTWPCSR